MAHVQPGINSLIKNCQPGTAVYSKGLYGQARAVGKILQVDPLLGIGATTVTFHNHSGIQSFNEFMNSFLVICFILQLANTNQLLSNCKTQILVGFMPGFK